MKNEQTPEFKALLADAWAIQDACNLCGLVQSFAQVMKKLAEIDRTHENIGTSWCNSNAVARLWIDKLQSLAGETIPGDWTEAIQAHEASRKTASAV